MPTSRSNSDELSSKCHHLQCADCALPVGERRTLTARARVPSGDGAVLELVFRKAVLIVLDVGRHRHGPRFRVAKLCLMGRLPLTVHLIQQQHVFQRSPVTEFEFFAMRFERDLR
jgi:hypothetical protein